ncbi:MAG: hypothetical protein AB1540_14770 [Bdellovibrionota bacterium]
MKKKRPSLTSTTLIASLATVLVLSFLSGCGDETNNGLSSDAEEYDASQLDQEITLEDLGGAEYLGFLEEAQKEEEIKKSVEKIEKIEQKIEEIDQKPQSSVPDRSEKIRLEKQKIKEKAIANAREWELRISRHLNRNSSSANLKYHNDHSWQWDEGVRRFLHHYNEVYKDPKSGRRGVYPPVTAADYRGYIFGGDPICVNPRTYANVFDVACGADCRSFVRWNYKNAMSVEAKLPMLATQYMIDIILPYLDVEKERPGPLSYSYRKQLAREKYVDRIKKKAQYLRSIGERGVDATWEQTHIGYFDYFNYVTDGEAQNGDYVVYILHTDKSYRESGHVALLVDINGGKNATLGASTGKSGLIYYSYLPNKTHLLRPNLNKILSELKGEEIADDEP